MNVANEFQVVFLIILTLFSTYITYSYSKLIQEIEKYYRGKEKFYLALNEEQLRCLMRGGVVKCANSSRNQFMELILCDIGFDRMELALKDAIKGKDLRKDYHEVR